MDPRLQKVFDLLNGKCPFVVIAGGAAVDFDKAEDIDLFFLRDNQMAARLFVEKNLGKLKFVGKYGGTAFKVVGELNTTFGKKIQVMCHKSRNAVELVNGFDISTHMKAWLSTGECALGDKYTHTGVIPQICNMESTNLDRYEKICKRYGFEPDPMIAEELEGELDWDSVGGCKCADCTAYVKNKAKKSALKKSYLACITD